MKAQLGRPKSAGWHVPRDFKPQVRIRRSLGQRLDRGSQLHAHVGFRLAAFQGVNIDAEDPGKVPPALERFT